MLFCFPPVFNLGGKRAEYRNNESEAKKGGKLFRDRRPKSLGPLTLSPRQKEGQFSALSHDRGPNFSFLFRLLVRTCNLEGRRGSRQFRKKEEQKNRDGEEERKLSLRWRRRRRLNALLSLSLSLSLSPHSNGRRGREGKNENFSNYDQ